jgi:hypothetical protein
MGCKIALKNCCQHQKWLKVIKKQQRSVQIPDNFCGFTKKFLIKKLTILFCFFILKSKKIATPPIHNLMFLLFANKDCVAIYKGLKYADLMIQTNIKLFRNFLARCLAFCLDC